MKNIIFKMLSVFIICFCFYNCATDDIDTSDYEVDIAFSGDIQKFDQRLDLNATNNDGGGLFQFELKPWMTNDTFFLDQDLELGTYEFVTSDAQSISIEYWNYPSLLEISDGDSMSIQVIIRRNGIEVGNFTRTYDINTGDSSFIVTSSAQGEAFSCEGNDCP